VSYRNLVPRILSPVEAETELAVPCWLILAGVAQPVFPNRDRGTPSPVVLISRVKNRLPSNFDLPQTGLPYPVDWRQWRTAVVPVLENQMWSPVNPVTAASITTGSSQEIISLLGRALNASFVAAGWGPQP